MKYLHQACLIFLFTALGELLHFLIPLPIPASIYGMILLFFALSLKLIKTDSVAAICNFLTSLLSLLFVPGLVGLLEYWDTIREDFITILVILFLSTILVFVVSGWVTGWLVRKKKGGEGHD